MKKWDRIKKITGRGAAALLAVFALQSFLRRDGDGFGGLLIGRLEYAMLSFWSPALVFSQPEADSARWDVLLDPFPLLRFLSREEETKLQWESLDTYADIIRAEGQDEYTDSLTAGEMETPETSAGRVRVEEDLEALLRKENGQTQGQDRDRDPQNNTISGNGLIAGGNSSVFLLSAPEQEQSYEWEYFKKFDALVKEFYAVDAGTAIDESQLNLNALLLPDLSVQKREDEKPQILIYHTHSQEAFADSVAGDANTTIMGVGEVLAQILREQYGYNVMHHMGQYDVENRDYAYNNSLPALEELLAENPGIEVVIDLHRDEVADGTRLVTEIDGRPTARFMFFNGLSRTKKHGDIEYLPNKNIADNLAFSFQMQVLCNEYYPGLTRRIYLKGYRYNMHLKPRYLLIEMGAQNNTYEECYNACIPLARILDMELSGADFGYNG